MPLMLWQTMRHNLAGMVYAETINGHLQALEEARHCRTTRVTGGLQLTWLYALATHCGRRRFALQRVRLERHALTLGVGTAGVSRRYELPLSGTRRTLTPRRSVIIVCFCAITAPGCTPGKTAMRLTGWIMWRTMAMRAETAATLRQIAQCYFPHALDRSAVQQLRRWIHG